MYLKWVHLLRVEEKYISFYLHNLVYHSYVYSPKMYTSMAERHRYREVLAYTTVVILATYLFIMAAGYYYFAQFTLSPGNTFYMYTCSIVYP